MGDEGWRSALGGGWGVAGAPGKPGTWSCQRWLGWRDQASGDGISFHPVWEGWWGKGMSRVWPCLIRVREQLGRLLVLQGVRSWAGAGGNSSFPSSLPVGPGLRKGQALTRVWLLSRWGEVTGAEDRAWEAPRKHLRKEEEEERVEGDF